MLSLAAAGCEGRGGLGCSARRADPLTAVFPALAVLLRCRLVTWMSESEGGVRGGGLACLRARRSIRAGRARAEAASGSPRPSERRCEKRLVRRLGGGSVVVREGGVLRVQARLADGLASPSVSAGSPSDAGAVVDDGELPSSSSGSFVPPPSELIDVSLSVLVNVRHSVSISVLLNAGLEEGEHSLTRVSLLLLLALAPGWVPGASDDAAVRGSCCGVRAPLCPGDAEIARVVAEAGLAADRLRSRVSEAGTRLEGGESAVDARGEGDRLCGTKVTA